MKQRLKVFFNKVCLDDTVRRKILFATGLLLTLFVLYPVVSDDALLRRIDYKVYDLLVDLVPDEEPSPLIAIVDIDDRSLQTVGQWPWPRYKTAELLKNINTDGAAAVGIDVVFAEEDRTSLKNIKKTFKDDFGVELDFKGDVGGLTDNDGYMAQVLSSGPFVVANFFLFDGEVKSDDSCTFDPVKIYGLTGDETFYGSKGVLCTLKKFTEASGAAGFINAMPDEDGIMRRLPLLVDYEYSSYPNLSLRTYMTAMGVDSIEIDETFTGVDMLMNGRRIPINRDGTVMLNFNNYEKRYKYYSAADILHGNFAPETFKGRIVLIGSSAAGMNDLHSTSSQAYCPGVEVHATFIDNMINNNFIRIPSWSKAINVFFILLCGGVISFYSGKARSAGIFILVPQVFLSVLGLSYLILKFYGIYISPTPALLTITVVWLALTLANYYIEERRSHLRTKMLSETQAATIRSMASVAETRDPETGGHIFRTQHYIRAIAEHLMRKGLFKEELNHETIELMYMSAPLHDVGKVGIPDYILLKPGKLTAEEFEIMKTHSELGAEIIGRAESGLSDGGFLYYAALIALSHHEKWDGTGYPCGLAGEDIPLCGRLMAVADVYDALISKRHYKDSMPHEAALAIIKDGIGRHFDPIIAEAFLEIGEDIRAIALEYSDDEPATSPL